MDLAWSKTEYAWAWIAAVAIIAVVAALVPGAPFSDWTPQIGMVGAIIMITPAGYIIMTEEMRKQREKEGVSQR